MLSLALVLQPRTTFRQLCHLQTDRRYRRLATQRSGIVIMWRLSVCRLSETRVKITKVNVDFVYTPVIRVYEKSHCHQTQAMLPYLPLGL